MFPLIRNLTDIQAVPTSHGQGKKKILLAPGESQAPLTQIAITNLQKGEFIQPHAHSTMAEFFFILKGKLQLKVEGEEHVLQKGDFVQVPPGKVHSLIAETDCELQTIGCKVLLPQKLFN